MVWRSWIRKPLLFAVAACLLTGGESAPYNPTYGYASAVAVKDYPFNVFSAYFTSPLNFDVLPGKIVVGAKDRLYLLDLACVQQLNISSSGCVASGQACPNNLVRLYSAPSANSATLVVCGSAGPQCSLVDTSSGNFTLTSEYVSSSPTLLTSDPNTPSLGIFTNITTARNTNFFAASGTSLTFHTFNTSDPTSLGTSLKFGINSTHNTFNLTTWFSSLLVIVDVYKADYPMRGFIPQGVTDNRNPDEHKYLFVFVREQDPMTLMVTNKLVRLCQNDPGSVSAPNGLPFPTTLLKANISCQSASGPLKQNLLQGVVFSRPGRYFPNGEWVELMYGTFTDYSGYSPQTSICVYRANDSDYSLASGANNKGVFDIFRSQVYDPVGGRYIANNYVECTPNGRTDLQSQQINLAQSIQQYNPEPLAILSNVVVTKMVVDQPVLLNGSSPVIKQDVLFLGTSLGSVIKLAITADTNGGLIPFVSENIQLGDSTSVRQMVIKNQSGVKYLYVNTDNGIYKLPLERCGRFQGCSGCVASRDPYCVWDTVAAKCVTLPGNPDVTTLRQNINTGVADDCTGSYAISIPTSDSTPFIPTTPSIGPILSPTSQGTLYLGVALGVTLPIIAVLAVTLVAFCLFVHRGKISGELKKVPLSDDECLGSPNSVLPLTTVQVPDHPSSSVTNTEAHHIYDITQGNEETNTVVLPPRSGAHIYGILEPEQPAGPHLYGMLEPNHAPVYSSLTKEAVEAQHAQPHNYESLNGAVGGGHGSTPGGAVGGAHGSTPGGAVGGGHGSTPPGEYYY